MKQAIKYYVSGHTAAGYVNYLPENLQGITRVIVLRGGNEAILTEMFKSLAETYEQKGYVFEIISGLTSKKAIVGIIIREIKMAILAEEIVQIPIPEATSMNLKKHQTKQVQQFDKVQEGKLLQEAYAYFEKGLHIHDELEKVYINEMDFKKADAVAANFIKELLHNVQKRQGEPVEYKRLFGTNIPGGAVNHVPELIQPINRVFYVKGRAGTGKSVFMKKVLHACMEYGFDTEVYHCSFDPESVDMIIVRELDFCLFDSTPPHEFNPENGKGNIIDLYDLTVALNTDERHQTEISKLTSAYQAEMKKGMQELKYLKKIYGEPVMNIRLDPAMNELNKLIAEII